MTINKEIKNRIDNLKVGDEILSYTISEIEDDIYTLDDKKNTWLVKTGGELFDMLYEEYIDEETNKGMNLNRNQ